MIKNQIMFWGAVASLLGLLATLYSLYYGTADDSTQPHQRNGIEEIRGSNIPGPPIKGTNQKTTKDLTLESLETDFSLIVKMSSSRNRDAGLMHLINKALQTEKYNFTLKAIEFALAMYSSRNRDEALRLIVDKALSQGHKDIAIRATDGFISSRNADVARQKILTYSNSSATQKLPAAGP